MKKTAVFSAQDVPNQLRGAQDQFARMQHDEEGFLRLSALLKEAAGIYLPSTTKNHSLMASRLGQILRRLGIERYSEYERYLRSGDGDRISEFVSALTTNTTQFFREANHFEILKKVVPGILERKSKKGGARELRVWCAAASTGQEPYSMLMVLHGLLRDTNFELRFLATDIDHEVLERAARGEYTDAEVASLPDSYRSQFLQRAKNTGMVRIHPEFIRKIRFAPLNLMEPFPFQHRFDIVFCRNVLIYFDTATCTEVIRKISDVLASGGYLFLGHSESGTMRSPALASIAHAVYQKKPVSGEKP